MKKIQADKKGCKYILFRTDILVSVFQQQKLMKKDILKETLFLRKKGKKHQKKNLVVNLLDEFKNKRIKKQKTINKRKRNEREIRKLNERESRKQK